MSIEDERQAAEALGPDRDRVDRLARERAERRERIATAALKGLLANSGGPIQHSPMSGWSFTNCKLEDVTELAVSFADALMAALGGES